VVDAAGVEVVQGEDKGGGGEREEAAVLAGGSVGMSRCGEGKGWTYRAPGFAILEVVSGGGTGETTVRYWDVTLWWPMELAPFSTSRVVKIWESEVAILVEDMGTKRKPGRVSEHYLYLWTWCLRCFLENGGKRSGSQSYRSGVGNHHSGIGSSRRIQAMRGTRVILEAEDVEIGSLGFGDVGHRSN